MLTALMAEMKIHNPIIWDCVEQDLLSILSYEKALSDKSLDDELNLSQ